MENKEQPKGSAGSAVVGFISFCILVYAVYTFATI